MVVEGNSVLVVFSVVKDNFSVVIIVGMELVVVVSAMVKGVEGVRARVVKGVEVLIVEVGNFVVVLIDGMGLMLVISGLIKGISDVEGNEQWKIGHS